MRLNLLGRRARDEGGHLARLKSRVREHLGLHEDDGVTVSEIDCTDPACPGTETVILVLRRGAPTRAAKLPMAAADATDANLSAALAPLRLT